MKPAGGQRTADGSDGTSSRRYPGRIGDVIDGWCLYEPVNNIEQTPLLFRVITTTEDSNHFWESGISRCDYFMHFHLRRAMISNQSNGATEVTTIPTSRFLLVDDDPALLLALSGLLQNRLGPCTVDACESGMQALDFIETHTYDTIISDVTMPGMDGLQFLRAVKTSRCDAPVFLMSGKADYALMTEALKAGANSFFAKPFDRDEIVAMLREGVALSRLKGVLRKEETVIRRSNRHHASLTEKLHQHDTASTMPTPRTPLPGTAPPVDQALQRRTDYRASVIRHLATLDKFLLKLTEIHCRTLSGLSIVQENIRRHALSGLRRQ